MPDQGVPGLGWWSCGDIPCGIPGPWCWVSVRLLPSWLDPRWLLHLVCGRYVFSGFPGLWALVVGAAPGAMACRWYVLAVACRRALVQARYRCGGWRVGGMSELYSPASCVGAAGDIPGGTGVAGAARGSRLLVGAWWYVCVFLGICLGFILGK